MGTRSREVPPHYLPWPSSPGLAPCLPAAAAASRVRYLEQARAEWRKTAAGGGGAARSRWLGRRQRHRVGRAACRRLLDGSGRSAVEAKQTATARGRRFLPLVFFLLLRDQQRRRGRERWRRVEWRVREAGAGTGPRIRSPPSDPRPRNRARPRADRACPRVFIHGAAGWSGPHAIGAVRIARRGTASRHWIGAVRTAERAMLLPACVAA